MQKLPKEPSKRTEARIQNAYTTSRVGDVIALIGTGPCLSDVTYQDRLVRARYCVALNGAVRLFPNAHAVAMKDPEAIKYLEYMRPEQRLIVTTKWLDWIHKKSIAEEYGHLIEKVMKHNDIEVFLPYRHMEVLPTMLEYALSRGYGVIELYGIDLEEPIHAHQRMHLNEIVPFNAKIYNCCPSSKLQTYTFIRRRWVAWEV